MADRVKLRVATARDGAEAALIRALLDGHGIHAHVAGEHHASMLGGLAGAMIPLHVWVDAEDAEPAAELIRSMRDDEVEPGEVDDQDELDPELDDDLEDAVDPRLAIEARKRTGIVLLLSCVVTFGTGHLYAGAWPRAVVLAALEGYGFYRLGDAPTLGFAMIASAVVLDAVGAMVLVRRDPALPRARLVA
jgi:hypothetical protein